MIAFVRRMLLIRCQRTGENFNLAMRRLVDAFRSGKVKHTGERPACPVCGSPKTKTTGTVRDGSVVVRYHTCLECPMTFQSIGQNEKQEPPARPEKLPSVGKTPKRATKPPRRK